MKRIRVISLLCCAFNLTILSMEKPPIVSAVDHDTESATPEQIEKMGYKFIVLRGPDAELHKLSSLMWAYLHPKDMEFDAQAITFPHYEYDFIKYVMKWEEVHKQVGKWDNESAQEAVKEGNAVLLHLQKSGPTYRFTFADKFALLKKDFKSFTEIHEQITEDVCDTPELVAIRHGYFAAFKKSDWFNLPKFTSIRMYCEAHAIPTLGAYMELQKVSVISAVVAQQQIRTFLAQLAQENLAGSQGVQRQSENNGYCAVV